MKEDTFELWPGLILLLIVTLGGCLLVPAIKSDSEKYNKLSALHSERYGWEMFSSCKEVDNNNGFCFTCEQKKAFLNASEEAKLKMLQIHAQREAQKDLGKSIEKAGKQVGDDIFWSRFLFGN